jgi:hypothetical protein
MEKLKNILFFFIILAFILTTQLRLADAQFPVAVWGYVYMPDGTPVAGALVTVSCEGESVSTISGSDGKYGPVTLTVSSTPVTVTVSASKDNYSGNASATGEGVLRVDVYLSAPPQPSPPPSSPPSPAPSPAPSSASSSSPSSTPTASTSASSVTITVSKISITPGEPIVVSGTIKPSRVSPIAIEFSLDKISWEKLVEVKSSSNGSYSYVWYPSFSEVIYYLRASAQSQDGLPVFSEVVSVQVTSLPGVAATSVMNVTLPTGKQCYVGVSSTFPAFNVTVENGKISVSVTGSRNTTGVTALFIPDTLLTSYNTLIRKMVFMVDGKEITPLTAKVVGGYTVTFTHTPGNHTIRVYYLTYELYVRVLDYSGSPVDGALLNLIGVLNRISRTNASGIAVFDRLIPGNYSIVVFPPETGKTDSLMVDRLQSIVLKTNISEFRYKYDELQKAYINLQTEYEKLNSIYSKLKSDYSLLNSSYNTLKLNYTILRDDFRSLQQDYYTLKIIFITYVMISIILIATIYIQFFRAKRKEKA